MFLNVCVCEGDCKYVYTPKVEGKMFRYNANITGNEKLTVVIIIIIIIIIRRRRRRRRRIIRIIIIIIIKSISKT